jgi:transcriptional regulator with XRE-family HTH domain
MNSAEMKSIRYHLNWSQENLARQLGVSLRTISRYEAGDSPIPTPVAIAVTSFIDGGSYGRAKGRRRYNP